MNRPLDGLRDPLAGHGTFICGLVRQVCPDADIIAIPVVEPDGTIPQSNLVAAIDQITAMVQAGDPVDVVSVSMGHYHESPDDIADTAALYTSLQALTKLGVVVVMSAGNDCTARASYPAALAEKGKYTWNVAPVVSVGALNPDGRTVAMFSNTGAWVTAWESGAALVSTMPTDFQFSMQAIARTRDVPTGKDRASVDPDDFSSGFAIASGTSFATPVVAGKIARRLAALGALDLQQTELRREAVRQVITR